MRRILLTGLLVLSLCGPVWAQEAISLTVPRAAKLAVAGYTPDLLQIALTPPRIIVQLVATDGTIETFTYPCQAPCSMATDAQVLTLIQALNSVNLTVRTLWRRIFDRLLLDFPARFVGGATVQ